MAQYSKLVITNDGQALIAKMIAGLGDIEFTKVCSSSTQYQEEQLQELVELGSIEQTTLISRVSRTNEATIKIEAAFSNADLATGYYMRALGLYAVDPDKGEILYAACIETTNNCYMPAYNGLTASAAYVQFYTTVGNAENVSLEVSPGAYATIGDIQDLQKQIADYLPLMGGTMTGPITTTSHIYGIDATTGERIKDINLDGDNISFGKRVSEANDAAWKTKIGIGDNTVSIESDILKFNGNGTSAIITENRADFSFAKGKFTETISSSGKVDLNTKDSFIMDIMGELSIGISEELNLVTGHKANIASATEIRLVPGATDADSSPAADKYVRTGNIKGIKDTNGNKPSISNFGDIRSETYNGNKILGTNGGRMDDGAEICFTKAEGSDSYSSNISAGQCVFDHVTPSQYTSDYNVEICADYIKVESTKFRNQSTHIRSYGIVSSGNLNNDYIIKMNDVGIRIFDGSVTPIYSSSPSTDLGGSNDSYKWRNIYAINGTIQTSDRTKKNNITKLPSDLVKDFIMGLQPSTYRMTDGTSGRTHWGLISQDIEELMEHLGMDSKDFAGFIKSPKIIIRDTDENGNALEGPVKEVVDGEYDYSLRYDEFIAPIIKVIQMQQAEIESLKADKAQLEERLAKIEERLGI